MPRIILSRNLAFPSTFYKFPYARYTFNRFIMTSCRTNNRKVEILCSSMSSNVDKKVSLSIRGLAPKQKITLRARLCGDSNDRFRSIAYYLADKNGQVNLNSSDSLGGSYTGVEPMGFMWAMKPEPGQKPGRRLLKRDVTKPYLVNIDVLDGHVDADNEETPLSSLTIKRYYMGSGVRRIEVKVGRIRGSLFLPPGDGPFQGVIDLLGSHGGLVEFKAALLASNGFAAMALAYFNYSDLPKALQEIELEYFQEAVEWLKNHPQVRPGGVGVLGISKGADIILLLAANCPDVAATVWVSGHHGLGVYPMYYQGKPLDFYKFVLSRSVVKADGSLVCRDCTPAFDDVKATPVENIKGQLLLVYGADDQNMDSESSATKIYERMKRFGKEAQCSLLGYHGAGHLIEPPYIPHVNMSYQKSFDICLNWGGETKAHAAAQEHFWAKTLTFFKENLPQNPSSKL
ncbi:acyl-coenzyme A amino acid N-acyltransferase 1-like [Actinia tenebrosa]|uniref:Acyl-coenzyme A amino acid N-acyltransferase 1-like n=1 Tax=Actinia tenebrosa TaxID=6105 RepID=A0A6P8IYG0_ACTTE|nr:acyl-coenzyme A amino acid N-acyltransferase 1-like [Actinia tenebrosa]